ncbi:hypothetical protein ACT3QO_15295, partial [Psychrobacter sp. AOP7-D1-15]
MIILDETNKLCLSHFYEYVQLFNKESNQILLTDDFYGDPTFGLIDISNEWAIIAGKNLTLWTYHDGLSETTTFDTQEFSDIEQLRLIDKDNISILIDPWSEYSAIWQLKI